MASMPKNVALNMHRLEMNVIHLCMLCMCKYAASYTSAVVNLRPENCHIFLAGEDYNSQPLDFWQQYCLFVPFLIKKALICFKPCC